MNTTTGERNFKTAFKSFKRTVKLACKISRMGAGRESEEDKMFWASVLFTRMCVISLSIQKLTDHDIPEKFFPEHWDYASTFSLTRNLMECFHTLYYLCFDNIPKEEYQTRRNIFNLHDFYSRKKLLSYINEHQLPQFKTDTEHKKEKQCFDVIMGQIENDTFFQKLPDKQKQKYLRGDNAFLISREEIEERSGRSKSIFKAFYKLLSSNTHSFPMGFYHLIFLDRGTGVKTNVEVEYSILALTISESYLISAIQGMLNFYPDLVKKLSPQELSLISFEEP
jgi:hypothetical protein